MSVVSVGPSETRPKVSADDLLAMPNESDFELVHGELVERTTGNESAFIAGRLFFRITVFLETKRLGWVFPDGAGYILVINSEESVRKPDVSFVSFQRLPPQAEVPKGYYRLAPNLAIEVVSPHDLADELDQMVSDYLHAGVRLVWVVHPPNRTVHVYRADGSSARLEEKDALNGEDVLPGFQCPIRNLFEVPTPAE